MQVRALVLGVVLTAGALLLAPAAQAVESLALTSTSPVDGATIAPTPSGGIPWQVFGGPPGADALLTITTKPDTTDGQTLSDANRVDFVFMSEDPTHPGVYTASSDPGPNAWSGVVGVYYWQIHATWTDAAGVFHDAVSPIARIGIGTAPPPLAGPGSGQGSTLGGAGGSATPARTTLAMSATDAAYYVRTVIRQRTKRSPAKLHYGCTRRSTSSFRCRPAWRDSRNVYSSATVTFTHARTGARIVARGTFGGRRSSRRCLRTGTPRTCGRRFTWHASTAARPLAPTPSS
jgi:hypothetical protein